MDTSGSGTLPPCRVCEAPATGLHYGVITCEACKAFYRRGLSRGIVYECPDQRACEISYRNRNSCAYCRFQKCLNTGMSKDAIKTGRYSYETRTSNLREARKFHLKTANGKSFDENSNIDVTMSLPSAVSEENQRFENKCENNNLGDPLKVYTQYIDDDASQETHKMQVHNDVVSVNPAMFNSSTINALDFSNISHCEFTPQSECIVVPESNSSNNGAILATISQSGSSVTTNQHEGWHKRLYDGSKVELYESIIHKLYNKYIAFVGSDIDISESLSQNEREYLEMIELRKRIFALKPMPAEEYFKFLRETDIDIDGRRELMLESIPLIELGIKQQIDFAKAIPGYRALSLNDQIALIKMSRMDFFMISGRRCFNPEHKLFSPYAGKVYHMDDWLKIDSERFITSTFNFQCKLKNLNLTGEETAILSALCIMCTDDCDLEDTTLVEHSQDFLLECLFYLFDKHHQQEKMRFSRVINCLTELRVLREDNIRSEEQILNIWCGYINFPPLFSELLT